MAVGSEGTELILEGDGFPQQGAQPGGVDAFKQIGDDNAIDHVGKHGNPCAITQAHGDNNTRWQTPDGSIEADGTRWTAETGSDEPLLARDLTQYAGGGGEPE